MRRIFLLLSLYLSLSSWASAQDMRAASQQAEKDHRVAAEAAEAEAEGEKHAGERPAASVGGPALRRTIARSAAARKQHPLHVAGQVDEAAEHAATAGR